MEVSLSVEVQGQSVDDDVDLEPPTLVPGLVPLEQQLGGFQVELLHLETSPAELLLARTSISVPQVWIYLRPLPFALFNRT